MSLRRLFVVLLAAPLSACLPDPAGEFDDFGARATPRDAGPADTGPKGNAYPSDFSGDYFAICMTELAPTVATSLRFSVATTYTAPTAGTGKVKMIFTPLAKGKTTYSAADKLGSPIELPEAVIDANGEGSAETNAAFSIPGEANPISGSLIVGDRMFVAPKITAKDKFCGNFSVRISKPFNSTPNAACLFFAVNEGDAIPPLVDADMHCP
jgi:hypothetical protein